MENNIQHEPQSTNPENPFLKSVFSIFAIILEVHILLINIIWIVIEDAYRCFVPVSEKSVQGEIALITGAGHGMGRELALLYASEGATVICWDVNEQNNEDTVKMINKFGNKKAYAYTCDVTDYDKVTEVCARIEKDVGDVSILINNAGIMPSKPFLQQSKTDIDRTLNINLMSHFWILQAVLPNMLKNNHGHIVAMSSLCGIEGMVNLVPYTTSKFAVRGLMAGLRKELEENDKCQIKTTTVLPYMIDTGLVKSAFIRFPSLAPMLKKEDAARYIMSAQRRNVVETSIPRFFINTFLMIKLLPYKAEKLVIDFLNIKVNADT